LIIKQWITLALSTTLLFLSAAQTFSSEVQDMMVGHAFYGRMNIENNDADIEGGDFFIGVFGADGQKPIGGGEAFKYGWETGLIFSIDSDARSWAASGGSGGGTVIVAVEVNSIMIDYSLGGYLAIEPNEHFRLYAGAGPLLIWARRETEPEESAPDYVTSSSESGIGAGLYARVGLDIFFNKQFGVFAGARINQTTLSFEDDTGKVDIEGFQYYGGIAFRF
jgi:opacity protein-like surface antigen